MTEPTFPHTFFSPWHEWRHVTPDGATVRIRCIETGGYIVEARQTRWRTPFDRVYPVSVNGRRVDSFLTFEAALRKAKVLVLTLYPTAEPAEMPDAPWRQIHG